MNAYPSRHWHAVRGTLAGLLFALPCWAQDSSSGDAAAYEEGLPSSETTSPDDASSETTSSTDTAGDLPVVPVDAQEPQELPAEATQLDDVVVTARKRVESIQDVPLSVSAYSGNAMRQRGLGDLTGIAHTAPNVEMERISPSLAFTYIRGIGTRRYDPGLDQSVATFVDGVYRGRSYSTNADLLAVERIEVLKGPQGTLYGKNTIGGAISVTTPPPRDSWGGNLTYEPGVSAVSGDRFQNFSLVTSGPLLEDLLDDRLGVGVALAHRDREGYQTVLDDDPPDGVPRGDIRGGLEDNWSGKLKLRWDITDALDLTLAGTTARIDGPPRLISPNDHGDPSAQVVLQSPTVQRPQFTGDPRSTASNLSGLFLRTDITDLSGHLTWHGDTLSITSITGFEDSLYAELNDTDGTALDSAANTINEDANQLTEELRFDLDWENLRVLFGLYAGDEETHRFERIHGGTDSVLADANNGQAVNLDFDTTLQASSQALFGQLSWDLAQRMELTAGLRYSRDRKEVRLLAFNDATSPAVASVVDEYDIPLEREWSSLDPLISLTYDVLADTMAYATYSTGYKSGGFQWLALKAANARRIFDPESVTNYEVGTKSTLWDRRLRINLSAFHMEYEDLQVLVYDSTGTIPVTRAENAARSTIQGVELEGTVLLGDAFAFDLSSAYLDAVYDDYLQDPSDPSTQRAGNRLPRSPKYSASAALTYTTYLGPATLRARTGYAWKDAFFWEPDNNNPPRDQVEPALGLWDASVGLAWGRYSLNLWGQNLSDELYRAMAVDLGPTNSLGFANVNFDYFGPPRTVGLQLAFDFE